MSQAHDWVEASACQWSIQERNCGDGAQMGENIQGQGDKEDRTGQPIVGAGSVRYAPELSDCSWRLGNP